MKIIKKGKIIKFIFYTLFFSFLIVYFSELTGYYEYQNYKKAELTKEQIEEFENDIKEGKNVDINNYLVIDNKKYNNSLSKITSKISNGISNIVFSGVENTFKFLSRLID